MRKVLLLLGAIALAGEAFAQEVVEVVADPAVAQTVEVAKHELFRQRDPSGGVMAIIAMLVVFLALVLIFFFLKGFGAAMIRMHEKRQAKPAAEAVAPKRQKPSQKVEEELAAIALALKMYQEEQHIAESTVITINRASRVYSPWSSKIHGIPPIPLKK